MVMYTLKQLWAKWACDRLTEDNDFGKKKSCFQMKFIFILAQETHKHTLKSRRTQNESRFGADFGPEA